DVFRNSVDPDWFRTYGVALRAGQDLPAGDAPDAGSQIVVNDAFVRRFFPSGSAIGQRVREVRPGIVTPWTIIGIVDDAIYDSARAGVPPTIYHPLPTGRSLTTLASASTLTVRSLRASPEALERSVASALTSVDPRFALTMQPLSARVAAALARE